MRRDLNGWTVEFWTKRRFTQIRLAPRSNLARRPRPGRRERNIAKTAADPADLWALSGRGGGFPMDATTFVLSPLRFAFWARVCSSSPSCSYTAVSYTVFRGKVRPASVDY
jgi:hypothetical protein